MSSNNRRSARFSRSVHRKAISTQRPLYGSLAGQGSTNFRLMRLDPGVFDQTVTCTLEEIPLDKAPPYKALSYAWDNAVGSSSSGSAASTMMISCNNVPIPVSPNLYAALKRLRSRDRIVNLWVDAVCINQQDPDERGHQVGIMRQIYQQAEEVAIWLGSKRDDDDLAEDFMLSSNLTSLDWTDNEEINRLFWLEFLRRSSCQRQYIFGAFCVFWLLSFGIPASVTPHISSPFGQSSCILNGIQAIMDQAWWQRSWILQETVVAAKATCYYATLSCPWTMITKAAASYMNGQLSTNIDSAYGYISILSQFARQVRDIEIIRQDWRNPSKLVSLLPLLRQFRIRNATDPRDKVYALLGMVQYWGGQHKIAPDYNLDVTDVYWQATITIIKNTQSLEVLCGTPNATSDGEEQFTDHGHPSWVIDWSYKPSATENIRLETQGFYDASSYLPPGQVRLHGPLLLEVEGVELDRIHWVSDKVVYSHHGRDGGAKRWREVVNKWAELVTEVLGDDNQPYAGGGTVGSAFWRTLCGNIEYTHAGLSCAGDDVSSVYAKWRNVDFHHRRTTSIIGDYLQEPAFNANNGLTDKELESEKRNAFHYAVRFACSDRKFFITEKGYIGTGPRGVHRGDKVFVVSGSRVPLILRPLTQKVGCRDRVVETLIKRRGMDQVFFQAGEQAKEMMKRTDNICNERHQGLYNLIGDAYVHGVMNGVRLPASNPSLTPLFLW
ncbi:heterokaryon incompatibility protein-domain-containing protein [Cercophora samala]|uniref:Heterokaryon incompatibility protein-domain-containing protein n=1 Tax=Cercophora samala TaxID=330535 RepID=A0AA40DF88_9PEZI|nr:heterokaryon incompatibility protein-domain-containing protein [Cercophora samala]